MKGKGGCQADEGKKQKEPGEEIEDHIEKKEIGDSKRKQGGWGSKFRRNEQDPNIRTKDGV